MVEADQRTAQRQERLMDVGPPLGADRQPPISVQPRPWAWEARAAAAGRRWPRARRGGGARSWRGSTMSPPVLKGTLSLLPTSEPASMRAPGYLSPPRFAPLWRFSVSPTVTQTTPNGLPGGFQQARLSYEIRLITWPMVPCLSLPISPLPRTGEGLGVRAPPSPITRIPYYTESG